MKRIASFVYGVGCYAIFFCTFLYAIGFLGNIAVPRSIDSAPAGPLWESALIDALLLGLFALQHSIMARNWFKAWWTRFVPAPVERSTYVLFSSLAMILMFWQWRPLGGVIWDVANPTGRGLLTGMFLAGFLIVLVTTFLINHFDLFGLRQVWLYLRGRQYTALGFQTPGPYRLVRHPLYIGWMCAFWAAPTMTAGRLIFAVTTTAYILVAIYFEERDLMRDHAEYREYRRRVPMLVPGLARGAAGEAADRQPSAA
ncbi:MAG TPA: isoprenylcysteine carboxylmethyltransferase family protein [Candidatus Polarisedimenticolia bacterium]|nr:isoprenylcysteine carboxylmethyltransferase family protein [Candidatus Polarisedimenticolia bacterium]